MREKVARDPRNWLKVTEDTGIGDPSLTTAAKGERFAKAVAERYAQLLYDLSQPSIY